MLKSYKQKLSKKGKKSEKDLTMWDEAISDIQKLIDERKREIKKLTKDIRTLGALRDSGMEFPEPPQGESAQ